MFSPGDVSFYIISLGCSKNQVDSEHLKGSMIASGFREAESSDLANLLIINTCGFITPAKEEAIDVILDAIQQKEDGLQDGFGTRVVVFGCLTRRYPEDIPREIPEIDMVYGLLDDSFIPALCETFDIKPVSMVTGVTEPLVPGLSYAYIKIAEGCSNLCTYCAIPLIRGPHRSLPVREIMAQVDQCRGRNVRELVIVAQDTAAYSRDGVDISELLKMIAERAPGLWIRLMYCHPDHITDELIRSIASIPSVVKYLDIPFQHASGRILRAMNRRGDSRSYLDLVARLRSGIPSVRIRSTFMVGFPGETEDDFHELIDFIKKASLDRVGSFMYSMEEGTPASVLGDTVPQALKKKRYNRLMKVQQKISMNRLQGMVGTRVRVVVEEKIDNENWIGRSEYDAPEVDGIFYLTGHDLAINKCVRALVTDAVEYDLIGETIEIL